MLRGLLSHVQSFRRESTFWPNRNCPLFMEGVVMHAKKHSKLKDRYGFPIVRGSIYRITHPGEAIPVDVRLFQNVSGTWLCEDLGKKIGLDRRIFALDAVHPHSQWVRLNEDREEIEPDRDGYDCNGDCGRSVLDQLCDVESIKYVAKAELRRAELLACQAMGCTPGDGSQAAEAAFELVYNDGDAPTCFRAYIEEMKRLDRVSEMQSGSES